MASCTLLADAASPLLMLPLGGGGIVAALFLTAAIVTGGVWLVRGPAAPRARKWFFRSAAGASLGAALFASAFVFLGHVWYLVWVALLVACGAVLGYAGRGPELRQSRSEGAGAPTDG